MSQYYPQQPGPFYPPEQYPEEEYYEDADFEYEEDDEEIATTWAQRGLMFCAGGCLVFLCMSCCILLGAGLWMLDPGSSLVSTPIPGSDIGLSFEEPAFPDESVVNEKTARLTILGVNRNAALATVSPVEGQELIVVTVELVNLGEEDVDFNERDFMLLNALEQPYMPLPGAVDGALGRGVLPGGSGLEGRLVFQVAAGEQNLVLAWDGGPGTELRYIYLQ